MSSQVVKDIKQQMESKEVIDRYEEQAPLRELQDNLSDVEHLLIGRPDQCISFWDSGISTERLETLQQQYRAEISAFGMER
jgi:hypothetical protein